MAGANGTAICPIHHASDRRQRQAEGRPCVQTGNKDIDVLIVATKLVHNLLVLVLTRSVKDFEVVGVRVFDPYEGV